MKNDRVKSFRWRCPECKGELTIIRYEIDYGKNTWTVLTKCLVCLDRQKLVIEVSDYIDISREFWDAYYKKLPPKKGGHIEKA